MFVVFCYKNVNDSLPLKDWLAYLRLHPILTAKSQSDSGSLATVLQPEDSGAASLVISANHKVSQSLLRKNGEMENVAKYVLQSKLNRASEAVQ